VARRVRGLDLGGEPGRVAAAGGELAEKGPSSCERETCVRRDPAAIFASLPTLAITMARAAAAAQAHVV
jgi:hypothetical protein